MSTHDSDTRRCKVFWLALIAAIALLWCCIVSLLIGEGSGHPPPSPIADASVAPGALPVLSPAAYGFYFRAPR